MNIIRRIINKAHDTVMLALERYDLSQRFFRIIAPCTRSGATTSMHRQLNVAPLRVQAYAWRPLRGRSLTEVRSTPRLIIVQTFRL